MLLLGLITSPVEVIIYLLILVLALTVHEAAHAYMAHLLGDDTAKHMGRLTLNPLAHLDLWGSILMLVAGFGWGKPVMVNPLHFENPKLDNITVALAGPVSNFLLACLLGLLIRFIPMPALIQSGLALGVLLNLTLMVFNLLPIPPLDGSKFLTLFLKDTTYLYFEQFGFYILMALIIFDTQIPVIPFILNHVVSFIFNFLVGHPISL
ncbi:MAG: site-2 protease family protein [Candidatus Berkelbacteria bacterium]